MPSHPVLVVCALIERDGRVLVAQRPAHKHLGLKWEFPGGKVEPGEQPEAALAREIREELGCELGGLIALPHSSHTYSERVVKLVPYIAQLAPHSAEPKPIEHAAIDWVDPRALPGLDLAAADVPVVESYLARRQTQGVATG